MRKMKIIVVHIGDILKYPPVLSLINSLEKMNVNTTVITTRSKIAKSNFKHVVFRELDYCYEAIGNPIKKLLNIFKTKPKITKIIEEEYGDDSVIWVTYNVSLKHMNIRKLYKKRYVLQLMELCEHLKLYERLPFHFDEHRLAENAAAVVVPEYNRAQITKAWWNLKKTPFVLPNKPFLDVIFPKNSTISDGKARQTINQLKGKKIILYQGILTAERPIDMFIKAVDKLGDDYAFVVMSSGENIYAKLESKNYYFIPFVSPPYHLEVTSHAYIGVMVYVPVKSEFSKLNALYCAPNKTFEYGMFGIPMLGNDLPGLSYLFGMHKCGTCFREFDEEKIIESIRRIESEYRLMSQNARTYYDSVDYNSSLTEVLESIPF